MISVVIPVYRDAVRARSLVQSLHTQDLPPGQALEIIVVDDGSGDGSEDVLQQCANERVRVITLARNMGRSAARNAGAELARGEFLAFIDCDCQPTDASFLAAHLTQLGKDCIATCGPVTGDGNGFWSRYQREASDRRARQHAQGQQFSGSSQNFAVRGDAFFHVGGFDIRYKTYGFEDRDLFARLAKLGTIGWCNEAVVKHLDQLSLADVLAKMRLAAGESAKLFAHSHAGSYRQLGYAALDVRLHPWLRPMANIFRLLLRPARHLDFIVVRSAFPYVVRRAGVKVLCALAYLVGSSEA
jgi:glycosyltransferase involved in cell wall biosynthesis